MSGPCTHILRLLLAVALPCPASAFPVTRAASAPPVRGSHGMVVSAEANAIQAGVSVLQGGGNAVDAAVAVAGAGRPGVGDCRHLCCRPAAGADGDDAAVRAGLHGGCALPDMMQNVLYIIERPIHGILYFGLLQALSHGLLIALDVEDNTRREARD